jgi:hypothetical protein
MLLHGLLRYWGWAGSNIGAMPGCGAVAVAFAACFRKPLARWWHKHFGAKAELAEIRAAAAAAHRIAADLFEHHTGHAHPCAPDSEKEAK